MARRTADQMAHYTEEGLKGYEAIWLHILKFKDTNFTLRDIDALMNVDHETIRDHIKRFVRGGYVEELSFEKVKTYRVINPVKTAPRLNKKGIKSTQGLGRDHMWRTMKMLGKFTSQDLAVHASTEQVEVKLSTAEDYIKFLCRAGYLKCIREGVKNKHAIFVFLQSQNTGHKAPMIQRVKNVYDPNLKKVVWSSQGGSNDR